MSLDWKSLHSLIGLDDPSDVPGRYDGVSSLLDAGPQDVSFLGNPRYESQVATTRAAAVLVPSKDIAAPKDCHLIVVDDPSAAFSKVIDFFQSKSRSFKAGISPGAHLAENVSIDPERVQVGAGTVLEDGVSVGNGTVIGSGCLIGTGVVIGKDCHLHPGVIIREGCQLGDRVILQPGCVIGSDGYGFNLVDGKHQKVPQVGAVEICDDVEVGANSCVDRARFGKTVIGEGTKIDNLVQIAHNVKVGKHCLIVAQSGIAGSSTLGDYVTIAAQAGVAGHLEVASQTVLAARGGFLKSIKEPGLFTGFPARPMADERRRQASLGRLPKLKAEVQALKKKLEELTGE